jgi:hypothetical protein
MTRRSTNLSRVALAFVLLLLSFGCETRAVRMEIPAFGNGNVDGVWLWRRVEGTGNYKRACRLELDAPQLDEAGTEVLSYLQVCDTPGQVGMNLKATIDRLPDEPSTIVVTMWYFRFAQPGQFKASAYNAAGESALSSAALSL